MATKLVDVAFLRKQLAQAERTVRGLNSKLKYERQSRRDAEHELAQLEARCEFWDVINSGRRPALSLGRRLRVKGPGSVWLLKSDWHVGQRVDPAACSGYNEFNMRICRERVKNTFERDVRMIDTLRSLTDIRDCYLWLGGDIITGDIHEDIKESNEKQPTEQTLEAVQMIMSGIEHLKKHCNFEHIHVVCNMGNHGRTTKDRRYSTAFANSYEALMYSFLGKVVYANDPKVSFRIARGQTLITECQGKKIRTQHGDKIKFGGGVGGVMIPVMKALYRVNKSSPADHDIMGHLHTWHTHSDFTLNGSLIGFTEYGDGSYDYEDPCQGLLVFAKRRKKPIHQERIFVD